MRPIPPPPQPGRVLAYGACITAGVLLFLVATPRSVGTPPPPLEEVAAAATPAPVGPSVECPEMNNPGGQIKWEPTTSPGPRTTDGVVRLPKLGVEAPIVSAGINTANQMVVPRNAHQVAWLDQGSFPGPVRNAVLAGHVKWSGVAGSFNRIKEMAVGDTVEVRFGERLLTYRVVWTCAFDRSTEFADQIMGYTHEQSVTLITCGGEFDTAARTHTKRIAVRAELIDSV